MKYLQYLLSLLPQGKAWPKELNTNLTASLKPLAAELDAFESRIEDLIRESDPRTTFEMLENWEAEFGLPDTCNPQALTLQERRRLLIQRVISIGGQSPAYFKALADMLGYPDATITEYRPLLAGLARCGDLLGGPHAIRHYWKLTIPNARLTYFRTGESRAGDYLCTIARAADLECLFNRLKPAHTILVFSYEGV